MNKRFKTGVKLSAGALLVYFLLVLSGIVSLNLTSLRKPISKLLASNTGLALSISGQLRLRLGPNPVLEASELALLSGNGADYFARLAELRLQLQLVKLLVGELSFNEVALSGLRVDRCLPTPTLSLGNGSGTALAHALSLHQIEGRDIKIECSSDEEASPLQFATIQGTAISGQDLAMTADMQWGESAFDLDLGGAPLDELLYSSKAYPFKLNAVNELTKLELMADVEDLFRNLKLRGSIKTRTEQPDTLLALLDIQPAGLPEIALEGRIEFSGEQLSVESMSGHFGAAPWSLSGSLDLRQQRPLLILTAQLHQLDLDALLLPGQAVPTPKQPAAVDFDRALPLSQLDLVDARIDLRLTELSTLHAPLNAIALYLELEAGQLQIDIVEVQSGLGSGSGRITLDRSANCPAWTAEARLSKVDLGAIGELFHPGTSIVGTLEAGQATLEACGDSLTDIRETLTVRANLDTLQIQPGIGLPSIRATDASIAAGWRLGTYLEAKLLLDEQAVNGRIEAGELALLNEGLDWPVRLELQAGDASLETSGSLHKIGEEAAATADVRFTAPHLGPLATLLGLNPAYRGAVALDMHAYVDAGLVEVSDFKLSLGKSDLAGELLLHLANGQLESELTLRSRFVDVDELQQLLPPEEEEPSPGSEPLDIAGLNIKLDLAFAEIRGPERSFTDVSLVGSLRDERIEDARLDLEVGAFSLVGQLDADLGEAQPQVAMSATVQDVDIGSILTALDLAEDINARAEQVKLLLTSSGSGWRELADNTKLDIELQQLDWEFSDQGSEQKSHLSLQEVVGSARPNTPVSLHLAGMFEESSVNGYVQLAPLGQVLDPVAPFPVRAVLGTDLETVMLDGVLHREHGTGLKATLQLSAMEQVVAVSELAMLHSPLPGLIIDASIALGKDAIQTIELSAALGSSRLQGKVVVSPADARQQVQIELTAPHLQTTDFSRLIAVYSGQENGARPSADGDTAAPSFLEILDDYLTRVPEFYDFDIRLGVDELMAHEDLLGAANLRAKINQQNVELGSLQLSLPGGDVDLNYTANQLSDGVHSNFDAHIEHFELGGLLQTLDPESQAGGILYVDTAINAVAPTLEEVSRTMQGHFDLALFPRNVGAKVLDLWATNLIFALMSGADDQSKQMNCLVARFNVDKGVMRSKSIMLDSTDIIVRGKGTIDLGQRKLDLVIAPQAKRERFLSVSSPIAITGPFDDFNVELAGAGWVGTAFRWYLSLVYVPWKWLTGERFPEDGTADCLKAMGWEVDNGSLPTSNILQ